MWFSSTILINLVGIIVAISAVVVAYYKWSFTYWKRKGVVNPPASIPFGNVWDIFSQKSHFGEFGMDIYNYLKVKGLKFGGIYFITTKILILIDTELIKSVMTKDFQHFVNHGVYVNEEVDPLTGQLFNLEDEKWKNLRAKLTPTFTSGKMKMMFETLANCADVLKVVMDKSSIKNTAIDIKEVLACFSTDVIGSCAFGVECNSLVNPNSEFRKYGKLVFKNDIIAVFRNLVQFMFPAKFLHLVKMKVVRPEITTFFLNMVRNTVQYREKNNVYRKDFMHLLIQLKNRGKVSDDGQLKDDEGKSNETALNIKEIAAQCFVFFVAGFETSSTTMMFALYELARNKDIQEKVRKEIRTVLKKYDNKITYDAIMELNYLEKVICETLRKYPSVPAIPRVCTKDYVIPGTDVTIEKGTNIVIPVLGIQRDPEYYPNPEVFDPERFSNENKASRPPFTWLPFGEGPRICIGLRFGLMQTKVGLTTLLRNYDISLNKKTKVPLVLNKFGFILAAKDAVWVDVKKLDEKI